MGVTGGLVRGIFFRNKSFGANDYNNGRSNLGEKKRWSSVRSYLCGDEFNSVLAVDDSGSIKDSDTLPTLSSDFIQSFDSILATQGSAYVIRLEEEESVRSSEATVTQPLQNSYRQDDADNQSQVTENYTPKKHQTNLVLEEDAAVIIQSAFRSYLAIRQSKQVEATFSFSGEGSPGKASIGTSVQVQTGHSAKQSVFRRTQVSANRRTLPKSTTQVPNIKEDWDDSTVSSTISKLRVQSRIEAMTKRERALAYAFSQQLRICSKKKQTDRSSQAESNIGWSWLERWMATRVPDNVFTEPRTNIQMVMKNRSFGIAGELESCASNDLPLQFESISEKREEVTEDLHTEKSANTSKRKSVPSYTRHNKVQTTKRDMQQQRKKAKKAKREMNAKKLHES